MKQGGPCETAPPQLGFPPEVDMRLTVLFFSAARASCAMASLSMPIGNALTRILRPSISHQSPLRQSLFDHRAGQASSFPLASIKLKRNAARVDREASKTR
jgi:hypothetical protein